MAGQVVAVASGKGGVGKTTTVVNLGIVLRRADHSVALVDADLGMANLATMLNVSAEHTLHDVLAGKATVEAALVEEAPGFAVLPGSESLSAYSDADPRNLRGVLESLAESYDFVLVDTGAGMSHEDVLPLGLADGVLLVTSPDPAAVGDVRKTAELAGLAEGAVMGLVVTKADPDTDGTDIAGQVGVELLGVIPHDPTVRESTAAGRPLEALDPDSAAAAAYRELAGALTEASADPLRGAPAAPETGTEPEDAPEESPDETVAEAAEVPDAAEPAHEPETTEPPGPEAPDTAADTDTPETAEAPAATEPADEPETASAAEEAEATEPEAPDTAPAEEPATEPAEAETDAGSDGPPEDDATAAQAPDVEESEPTEAAAPDEAAPEGAAEAVEEGAEEEVAEAAREGADEEPEEATDEVAEEEAAREGADEEPEEAADEAAEEEAEEAAEEGADEEPEEAADEAAEEEAEEAAREGADEEPEEAAESDGGFFAWLGRLFR